MELQIVCGPHYIPDTNRSSELFRNTDLILTSSTCLSVNREERGRGGKKEGENNQGTHAPRSHDSYPGKTTATTAHCANGSGTAKCLPAMPEGHLAWHIIPFSKKADCAPKV